MKKAQNDTATASKERWKKSKKFAFSWLLICSSKTRFFPRRSLTQFSIVGAAVCFFHSISHDRNGRERLMCWCINIMNNENILNNVVDRENLIKFRKFTQIYTYSSFLASTTVSHIDSSIFCLSSLSKIFHNNQNRLWIIIHLSYNMFRICLLHKSFWLFAIDQRVVRAISMKFHQLIADFTWWSLPYTWAQRNGSAFHHITAHRFIKVHTKSVAIVNFYRVDGRLFMSFTASAVCTLNSIF